jgi:heptosyltransferase-2
VNPDSAFCTIWPGARWETKRWYPDRFSALIDRLLEDHGLPSVIMGDPTETTVCNEVGARCASGPAVLAGKTTIRQAAAILERAALVVTHDSAPMHLAAALERPLVAILGPTNPGRTGPYEVPSAVLTAGVDCAPCYLKRMQQCPYDHRCMRDISVADVLRHAEAALSEAVSRRL